MSHAGGGQGRRYAIIGGGFAGVATAWHLLAAGQGSIATLDLFDASGLGGGASGAAAGLLHPYTPKGKVPAWRSVLCRILKEARRTPWTSSALSHPVMSCDMFPRSSPMRVY